MNTADPAGDGGGGGTSSTSVDNNVTAGIPSTDAGVPAGSQHPQHPPPSPLSGCYLLVVLPEPHTAQHKDLILNRLAKGFLSWDKNSCHVDLEKELQALVAQAPEGEEARNGERLIQYATENLVTEVLIHPQTNTLLQCIRNLLASFTKHRHIIHAGYTFGGNGSWILQDGTFSLADFLDAFSEHEVQRVLRAYENSVTVDVNCAGVGEWSTCRLSKEACTRSCRVRLNPDDVLTAGVAAIVSFTNYVGQYLLPQTLDQLMEPSDLVGNIRFSHPTLYVFPGGQGDAALFGINGFNMLVDGGFARKACFWDFARHLDRLDAVLVTRVNNSNVGGMSSVLRKKREMHVYPQIGHFFCNLVERRHSNSPDGDKDLDPLTLNLIDIGQEMMVDLRQINLRAHPCYRDSNPINLYHKVGHGTLDMYVLSPSKDSREVREFLSKWHSADAKLFAGSHKKDSNNLTFPIQNLASICALLVWQPANPEDTITRILFPGSTPQHKIFEGFERLKHLDFLKHPVCSAKTLSPATSLLALKDRPTIKQKLSIIDKDSKKSFETTKKEKRDYPETKVSKPTAEDIVAKSTPQTTPVISMPKVQHSKIDVKTKKVAENKKIETETKKMDIRDTKETTKRDMTVKNKDVGKIDKDVETKKHEGAYRMLKSDSEKIVPGKDTKSKSETKKKDSKPGKIGKIMEMPVKSVVKQPEKKPKLISMTDKKDLVKGSPPTPKKMVNVPMVKPDITGKTTAAPRPPITKSLGKQTAVASTMPGKSAKDANNRKVVEQKNIEIASAANAAALTAKPITPAAKPKTSERKPISRRGKPSSPGKPGRAPGGGSPAKSTRSTPTTSVKSDKDSAIRRPIKVDRGGTTDSSAVSTPSAGIDVDSIAKLGEKSLTEKSEDMSLDSIESKVLADLKEEREVVEEIEAVLKKAERIEGARKDDHLEGDDEVTAEATDKKDDDTTEDDVTADMEEISGKKGSRKPSAQELTEEDEYLIVEKEEIYIEDSGQSGDGEQKHVLDAVQSEKIKGTEEDAESLKAKPIEPYEPISEEKEKSDVPEKKLSEKEPHEIYHSDEKERSEEETKDPVGAVAEVLEKIEDKDDSGKKDSEDATKEPSSLSPDKLDSSEKKTTDTDPMKPEAADQRDQRIAEKLEESQERMSTMESGATTTAPTLPEDERIPLDDIKEVIDEKYIADEDNEKKIVEPVKHSFPTPPVTIDAKPGVEPFQVRPTIPSTVHREIVKTPDEVADLPVHEEVDPKLYRMEHFDKVKDEKSPLPPTTQQQQQQQQPESIKEPPTPTVKEQKGVFSFFGKVADKFEKGMDKLTGKSRRDSEKDIDEKSSSKSSSPKEAKPQEMTLPGSGETRVKDALSSRPTELLQSFESTEPDMSNVKVAAITDTANFLQREIDDSKIVRTIDETIEPSTGIEKPHTKMECSQVAPKDPVFQTCVMRGQQKDMITVSTDQVEEDAEEVEALLEEASKKFKTVKDSLRDSLESLEDKIVEEEMVRAELAAASKDVVKDTLSEVVEKLEEMQPRMDEQPSSFDTKQPEKVKFDIPRTDDDFENEDDQTSDVTKDFREAVRDVGEVLAGSAGIVIEEKSQDVEEIVKKVAEELKRDDFLSRDALLKKDVTTDGDIETSKVPTGDETISKESTSIETSCVKAVAPKIMDIASPTAGDKAADKIDAMKICSDLMDEQSTCPAKRIIVDDDDDDHETTPDVVEAGIESICVKERVKRRTSQDDEENREINDSDIIFDRKLSPDKAQMVMVTPDSMPTSPKFPGIKIDGREQQADHTSQLSNDLKIQLDEDGPLENIIENLLFVRKKKITIEIVEYITVIRKIPREKVVRIIEEIIIKKKVPRDSVIAADLDSLRSDTASSEKRADIERYIDEEYITKNKKITIDIVEEISMKKFVTKRIVIEIIEEIIVKRKISRDKILDISEKELSFCVDEHRRDEARIIESSRSSEKQVDEILKTDEHALTDATLDIEKYVVDNILETGKKITHSLIDDIAIANQISRRLCIEILEKIMIERNISKSSVFDVSEKELSNLKKSEKQDMDRDELISERDDEEQSDGISVSLHDREQIEKNIIDQYVTKNRKITPYILDDICSQHRASRRTILLIIEQLAIKLNVSRSSISDISNIELDKLLATETLKDDEKSSGTVDDDDDKRHGSGIEQYEFDDLTGDTEKYAGDDFEAVEQEYKIHGTPITTDERSMSIVLSKKVNDKKTNEGTEEAIEDDDVVEADEKIIESVAPIMATMPLTEKKSDSISETSEAYDPMDNDFIEIHEEAPPSRKSSQMSETLVDRKIETDVQMELDRKASIVDRKDSVVTHDGKDYIGEKQITSGEDRPVEKSIEQTVRLQTEVEAVKVGTAGLKEAKDADEDREVVAAEDSVGDDDVSRVKRSIDNVDRQREHSGSSEINVDGITDTDDGAIVTGTVHRMLVTASSEDGGLETEVCPTGSIIFSKTTPDDSLKSSPVKTTPEQDSLVFDKESLRSGTSTPEKDSISGKSTPGAKDGDKISAEDSLDKSPSGARDLQDLDDSLESSEPATKLKQMETVTKLEQDQFERIDEKSRSSSVAGETHVSKEITEYSRSPSIAGEKIIEQDIQGTVDKSRSPSFVVETDRDNVTGDGSKSSSIVDDRRSEKDVSHDDGEPIVSQSDRDKDDRLKSSGIVADRHSEKVCLDIDEQSRRPTIASATPVVDDPTERSRSPSVAGETLSDEGVKESGVRSKSPTIVGDREIEKAGSEIDRDSRSPSVAGETSTGKEITEFSKSPSVPGDKDTRKKSEELADKSRSPCVVDDSDREKKAVDRSKSPSIVDDLKTEKSGSHIDEKSRSPGVAGETHIGTELTEHPRSLGVLGEMVTEGDAKEGIDESRSPSVASESDHGKTLVDRSKSPNIVDDHRSEKASSDVDEKSRSPSVASEIHIGTEITERSRSPSIVGEKITGKDIDQLVSESTRSPSVVSERDQGDTLGDQLKSLSIIDDDRSEKATSEIDGKSLSPSVASVIHVGTELAERSRSPSIAGEKVTGKGIEESVDESKSPGIVDDHRGEKASSEVDEKSRSPSIASETHVGTAIAEHSKTPSVAGDTITEKDIVELVDKSRSPSVIGESDRGKEPGDRSKSPSIVDDGRSEKAESEVDEKSRSPSVASGTHVGTAVAERSRSPSIASERITSKVVEELPDKSRSPSLVSESDRGKSPGDHSKSPSIVDDRQSEKIKSEIDEKSRSPSVASETHVGTAVAEHSKTSSVAGDMISEKNVEKPADKSRSPSVMSESDWGKATDDHSKSPSIVDDRQSEKAESEIDEKSRSPSVASAAHIVTELAELPKTPSVAGDTITEKDIVEPVDKSRSPSVIGESDRGKEPGDHSKSPSIVDDARSEKAESEIDEKSRSPSVASETHVGTAVAELPKTPSVAGDTITEKDIVEPVDKSRSPSVIGESDRGKEPGDHSKSPSIVDDARSEKAESEIDEKSRSPSVASETHVGTAVAELPKTPSVAGDTITEKDIVELVDKSRSPSVISDSGRDKAPGDHSKSPSIVDDRQSEKAELEIDEKSRSPSIASETHAGTELAELPKTPSVAGDTITEKDIVELVDKSRSPSVIGESDRGKEPGDHSKSLSIVDDRQSEKAESKIDEKSRSPSITSETHAGTELAELPKTPSVAGDTITEKDIVELVDKSRSPSVIGESDGGEAPGDHSKSSSIVDDRQSEKAELEIDGKSRSPSVASETHVVTELAELPKTPSVAGDTITEKDIRELTDKSRSPSVVSDSGRDKAAGEHSKSASIVDDRQSEKAESKIDEKSRSPSIASETHAGTELAELPKTPSVAGDTITEKDIVELVDKSRSPSVIGESDGGEAPGDHSKSPSIVDDRQSEKAESEIDEKSRSPIVASESHVGTELAEHLETPSVATEVIIEKKVKELDVKPRSPSLASETDQDRTVEHVKSPNIVDDHRSEKTSSEVDEKSRSPSIAGEAQVGLAVAELSRSPSIAGEMIPGEDIGKPADRSRSPSVVSDSGRGKAPGDHSKSLSIVDDRQSEKAGSEIDDKSRSPSVASETHVGTAVAEHSETPSVAGDMITETDVEKLVDKSRSPSVMSESDRVKAPDDHSKSPGIVDDRQSEKAESEIDVKSRSPSVASEEHVATEVAEHLKTPSVAGDVITEKDVVEPVDKSRSPSVMSESDRVKASDDHSKSPSIIDDRQSEKAESEIDVKSRSPSVASETHVATEVAEDLKTPSVAGDVITEKDVVEPVDKSRSPSVMSESDRVKAPDDHSKSPSIIDDRQSEKAESEFDVKSRSPSVASETHVATEVAEHLKTPSVAGDLNAEKDAKELVDKSRSPSVISGSDKAPGEHSKSASIVDDRQSEKAESEIDEKSRSPSITGETHVHTEVGEHSKSPSAAGFIIAGTDIRELTDKSRSPSVVSDSGDDKVPREHSKSPSIVDDRQSEKAESEIDEKSRSTSITGETHVGTEPDERSKSVTIGGEKITAGDVTELADKSRSPTVVSEKDYDRASGDHSKLPTSSIDDRQSEKEVSIIGKQSRSPSVAGDAMTEKVVEEPADKSRSPSVIGESGRGKAPDDRSKSPSIADDRQTDRAESEIDEKSRSPSAAGSEALVGTGTAAECSRSPSIAGEEITVKDVKGMVDESKSISVAREIVHDKALVDVSKSPHMVDDGHCDEASSAVDEKSRSISITSETSAGTEIIEGSRSPSIAGQTIAEKEVTEAVVESKPSSVATAESYREHAPVELAVSPSIVADRPSEKAGSEIAETSRSSPGTASEIYAAGDSIAEYSRSPSIADEKVTENNLREPMDKSRSPSVVGESEHPPSSPRIVGDRCSEKTNLDIDEKSRSPSVASETPVVADIEKHLRSLSLAGENITETDKKEPVDESKSRNVACESDHDPATGDHLKSSGIVIEAMADKDVAEQSQSLGITGDRIAEKNLNQVHTDLKSVDIDVNNVRDTSTAEHAKLSGITGAADQSIIGSDASEKSSSVGIVSETHDSEIVGECLESGNVDAKTDDGAPIDPSKMPSITGDGSSGDKWTSDVEEKSRSSEMVRDMNRKTEPADRSRSPSVPQEKIIIPDFAVETKLPSVDDKTNYDEAAVTGDRDIEKDSGDANAESVDRSKIPSIIGDTHSEPTAPTTSSSTAGENIADKDLKQLVADKPKATESLHETIDVETVADSSKLLSDTHDVVATDDGSQAVKESIDVAQSPETKTEMTGNYENESAEKYSLAKESVTDSRSISGRGDEVIDAPGVKSPSEKDVTEVYGERSRSASITGIKNDDNFDRDIEFTESQNAKLQHSSPTLLLASPSTAGEKDDATSDNISIARVDERSRSTSIISEKHEATISIVASSSPSPVSDTGDKTAYRSSAIDDREKTGSSNMAFGKPDDESAINLELSTSTGSHRSVDDGDVISIEEPDKSAETREAMRIEVDATVSIGKSEKSTVIDDERDDECDSVVIAGVEKEPSAVKNFSEDTPIATDANESARKSRSSSFADVKKNDCEQQIDDEHRSTMGNVRDSKLDGRDAVQALQKLAETIADKSAMGKQIESKSPIDEIDIYTTPKDRSRSHSVFDAVEKTPLGRSRTASLFDDRLPEGLSSRAEPKIGESQEPAVGTRSYDESDEIKSANEKNIAGQSIDNDDPTTEQISMVEAYIVDNYIMKKEKINSRSIDEIVTVYSIPKNLILELIEFIIIKENVPRDFVVDYPKYDGTRDSAVALSENDRVDAIDIAPAKRNHIESYIHEEFIKNNKRISFKLIDELATRESISSNIIEIILEEIMRKERISRTELIDDEPLRESFTEHSEADSHEKPMEKTDGPLFHEESLPSISNEYNSVASQLSAISGISEQKRIQVEAYVMEECVKKGKKITIPVIEQIIMTMSISRSVLLDIIENIIVTRKMSRTTMVDDAIYDAADTAESLQSPESLPTKDRTIEFSGKSTPDPKSSGYSTPETRRYDDKLPKAISSFSTDFESPFHKAFVGGMTEIRTTHITTLSGKSTPDFGARGETPESLSDGSITGGQTKSEQKPRDTDRRSSRTSEKEFIDNIRDIASTMSAGAVVTTTKTSDDIAVRKFAETSEPDEKSTGRNTLEDMETHGETASARKLIEDKEKPDIIARAIERDVIGEGGSEKETDDDDEPEIIRRVIRREIIERDDDDDDDDDTGLVDHQRHTISRRISGQEDSPDTIETITSRTIKTIVTEDMPHYEKYEIRTTVPEKLTSESESAYVTRIAQTQDSVVTGGPISADVKTRITTVTTVTEPDGKVTTKKNVQESTDTLEGEELLEKLIDSTKSEDSGTLTDAKSIESLTTEKIITETIKTVAGTLSSGGSKSTDIRGDSDRTSGKPMSSDYTWNDEKMDNLVGSPKISADSVDHAISPIIKDLISDERKSTSDLSVGSESGRSGRSTPDKRSSTATPEGFRSSEVIRTTITTTRTMSEDGDIITTTKEITEATNEKGEVTVLTEKTNVKVEDKVQTSPRNDGSSVDTAGAMTHAWVEGSDDRHGYSDDDVPGSPLSTTSIVGYSPQSTYHFGEQSFDKDSSHKTVEFSEADMSSSFYGELPDLPPRVTTLKTAYLESGRGSDETSSPSHPTTIEPDFSFKKFTVEKTIADSRTGKSGTKRYVDDADLDVEKVLMDRKDTITDRPVNVITTVTTTTTTTTTSSSGAAATGYTNGNLTKLSVVPDPSLSEKTKDEKDDVAEKDPLADWGTPLGLPSPKPPRKFNLRTTSARPNDCTDISPDSLNFDTIDNWGEPLRLPSPGPINDEASNKASPGTPKKERKQPKKVVSENMKNRKRSESPSKNDKKTKDVRNKIQPVYMDLTYVPHHGNSYYTSLDFFKRIRARYYVFSGTEPSREVYDALLDAKKTWEDKDLEVTMIPTYDTDTLGYWVADNEEALAANHIDLSPSASRCTINLQDHETSCSAYRLEF